MGNVPIPSVTMFFSHTNKKGWTEKHYFIPNPIDSDVNFDDLLTPAITGLALSRVQLLGKGASLDAVRLSYDSAWRDSRFRAFGGASPDNLETLIKLNDYGKANPSDDPSSVTVMRLNSATSYRKMLFLGGFPKVMQPSPPLASYPQPFSDMWKAYGQYLCTPVVAPVGAWGFVVQSKFGGRGAHNLSAVAISGTTNQTATFTYGAALTGSVALAPGATVRILGVKTRNFDGRSPLNGVYTIDSIAAGPPTTFTVTLRSGVPPTAIHDLTSAYYFVTVPIPVPYTSFVWDKQTHRKRGAGAFKPKGKIA